MKNRVGCFFIIFLFALCLSISAVDKNKLTYEFLQKSKWEQYWLFFPNNYFIMPAFGSIDCMGEVGVYSVKNGKLNLYIDKQKEFSCDTESYNEIAGYPQAVVDNKLPLILKNGILKYDPNDLFFSHYIVFEKANVADSQYLKYTPVRIGLEGSKVKAGKVVAINKIRAVKLSEGSGMALSNLNIRSGPSVNFKKNVVYSLIPEEDSEWIYRKHQLSYYNCDYLLKLMKTGDVKYVKYEFIPKGNYFEILARTQKKYKVGNDIDYWYYVQYGNNINRPGWVFGKYVEISG